jgi:thiamine biosynthesis lipoprotein
MLYGSPGRWVPVGEVLFEALTVARQAAERSGGAVDPTVACAMERMGYDRDFAALSAEGPEPASPVPAPGYRLLELDPRRRRARLPEGVRIDLGATAKALAADRAAAKVAGLGTGVVVSIGGDLSIAGPAPASGWHVGIAADSGIPAGAVDEVVAMSSGGLASSSTTLRSWVRGGRRLHHIVDPRTGDCVPPYWQLVSVAASSCVEANTASTAAVVWGPEAPSRLEEMRLPARLVRHDGTVVTTRGWPAPGATPDGATPDGAAPDGAATDGATT